ncbi:MAG: phosphoribosylformylglycinamidine synthase subunit PurS [Ignavibacteriales bacterium]|nr:phosphoribosylformylglycinamidine synthase subunit PurS [Ignavibacteriales bacterium]
MYQSKINVTLRKSILDPQGKAVHHGLESQGLKSITEVRIGKYIELMIDVDSETDAKRITEEACKKLLANPVMEDYTYTVEKISS